MINSKLTLPNNHIYYWETLVHLANSYKIVLCYIIRDERLYTKGIYKGLVYELYNTDKRVYSLMCLICDLLERIAANNQKDFTEKGFMDFINFLYDLRTDLNILKDERENTYL